MLREAAELGVDAGKSLGELIHLVGKISEPGSPVLVQIWPYDLSGGANYLFRSTTPDNISYEMLGAREILYIEDRKVTRFIKDYGRLFLGEGVPLDITDIDVGTLLKAWEVAEIARPLYAGVRVLVGESAYDFVLENLLTETETNPASPRSR